MSRGLGIMQLLIIDFMEMNSEPKEDNDFISVEDPTIEEIVEAVQGMTGGKYSGSIRRQVAEALDNLYERDIVQMNREYDLDDYDEDDPERQPNRWHFAISEEWNKYHPDWLRVHGADDPDRLDVEESQRRWYKARSEASTARP
jgi:hypothetical protein